MPKKDFTNSPLNPFANAKAAAESTIFGYIATEEEKNCKNSCEMNENSIPLLNTNKSCAKNNTESSKSRSEKDKEKGRQHLHLILPTEQVDAIKRMATSTGLTLTEFISKIIDSHIKGDWKPVLEQILQIQEKLGIYKNTSTKTLLGM